MWDDFPLLHTFAYVSAGRFMFYKASETFCENESKDIYKHEDSTEGNATRYCHSKNEDTGFTFTFVFVFVFVFAFVFTRRNRFERNKFKKIKIATNC